MQFLNMSIGVYIAALVALSGAAAAYDHSSRDAFVPVGTIDSDALMRANDKEYLMKKTANLVDLFYETGFPKRIAKFVKISGALLENNSSNDPMVNEIFGKSSGEWERGDAKMERVKKWQVCSSCICSVHL